MKRANTKASMALLMVGLLVAGGAGTLFVAAANPFGFNASAPTNDTQHFNLTVQVGAVVEGKGIPIIGAEVSIWSVSVNKTNDSVSIVFTRVAHTITEAGGNVTFNLAAGQYIMIANYSGLQSVKRLTLDADMQVIALLHNSCHHGGEHWMCDNHREGNDRNEAGDNEAD